MDYDDKIKYLRNYFVLKEYVEQYLRETENNKLFFPCTVEKDVWRHQIVFSIIWFMRKFNPDLDDGSIIHELFGDDINRVYERACGTFTENKKKKKTLMEQYYEPDKKYPRDVMMRRLLRRNNRGFYEAPRHIVEIAKNLPAFQCPEYGVCTTIPEVVFVYLSGRG
jgi:hypothetical protein